MNRITQRPRAAFTLIELLTVIAIIGILAAILIPVVGRVRENARQSVCGSNLRQIAVAVLVYEGENGVLPGPIFRRVRRVSTNEPDMRELNWVIDSYIGASRSEVWDCPSNTLVLDDDVNRGGVVFVLNNRRTATVPGNFFGYPAEGRNPPIPISRIERAGTGIVARTLTEPSQIWMISDADGWNYDETSIGGTLGAGSVPIGNVARPVHNDGRNYVFFDGHLEFRRAGEFPP
jgi:prepilin-type N-terminal cleavage/methylation domain-containing protein/prepilin-type processing-associated H-X9-DG protein